MEGPERVASMHVAARTMAIEIMQNYPEILLPGPEFAVIRTEVDD